MGWWGLSRLGNWWHTYKIAGFKSNLNNNVVDYRVFSLNIMEWPKFWSTESNISLWLFFIYRNKIKDKDWALRTNQTSGPVNPSSMTIPAATRITNSLQNHLITWDTRSNSVTYLLVPSLYFFSYSCEGAKAMIFSSFRLWFYKISQIVVIHLHLLLMLLNRMSLKVVHSQGQSVNRKIYFI